MLTDKQNQVLDFIREYQLENGSSPTIKEIRQYMKVNSDNSVLKHLNALVEKGYIEKGDTPRSIGLLADVKERFEAASQTYFAPVLGCIPAGGPIVSEENIIDRYNIDISMVKTPASTFLLRVVGDSMIDIGIMEGDLVIVDSSIQPKLGDVVVALVDGGNTVKRYMIDRDGRIFLRPENAMYSDIYPETELWIQGVVTGLVRKYL